MKQSTNFYWTFSQLKTSFEKPNLTMVNKDNRKNNVRTKGHIRTTDGDIIKNLQKSCTGIDYEDLIDDISTCGLKDKCFHLTNIDNQIDIKNIINRDLKQKNIDVFESMFGF